MDWWYLEALSPQRSGVGRQERSSPVNTSRPADGRVQVSGSLEGDATLVVHLTGELDAASAPDVGPFVQLEVAASRPRRLVLDVGGLSFVDSSGLALLLALRSCVPDGALSLRSARRQLRRLLEITGADALLPVVPDGDRPVP